MPKAMARRESWRDPVKYAIAIAVMGLVGFEFGALLVDLLTIENDVARRSVEAGCLFLILGALELFFIGRPLQRSVAADVERSNRRTAEMEAEAARQEFEGKLARALDMAQDEMASLDVVDRALALAAPGRAAELLLADSSRAHLVRAAGAGAARACSVESPRDCVAVRRGQTLCFKDGDELDACPYLRDRGDPCAAVCVPVNVLGNTVGVLHVTGRVGDAPDKGITVRLETISTQAGARVGMLRALHRSEIQAATDPLTGLLNRRSAEDRIYALMRDERPFAIAMCDLDSFKVLNDTHGHEAGDRALRLFSSTLKSTLRPSDLAARYGGEEFLLVFPDCGADAATAAVERLREELALAVQQGGTAPFTASFGVADLSHGPTLEEMMKRADDALLTAKRAGKNRVLVAETA